MLTRHHRKPKKLKGGNGEKNISLVPDSKHKAYHLLFNHMSVEEIARELNQTWIDPEYILIVRRRK